MRLRDGLGELLAHFAVPEFEPVVGEELVGRIGHEGGLVRADLLQDWHQVLEGVAGDVELAPGEFVHQRLEGREFGALDVAFVGTRMHREAARARFQGKTPEVDGIGEAAGPRIAQERDSVEIDGKLRADHGAPQ